MARGFEDDHGAWRESGHEWERPKAVSRQVQYMNKLGGYAERKARRDPTALENPDSLLAKGPAKLRVP